jgi:hypothetical protein
MHIDSSTHHFSHPPSPYPSPPLSSPTLEPATIPFDDIMSSKGTANVDGVGALTYQRAIDIARNTEGDLDPNVNNYLEGAIADIWQRINDNPQAYILSRDEFAVFNYYIRRFEGSPIAEQAVARYWRATGDPSGARR